jgi:hypothetical protein
MPIYVFIVDSYLWPVYGDSSMIFSEVLDCVGGSADESKPRGVGVVRKLRQKLAFRVKRVSQRSP